jgi:hypothetical protein
MAQPYDPLSLPMPSKKVIIARARRRAHRDTLAAMAKLPTVDTVRRANASLVESMGHNLADFRSLASGLGSSYAQGVRPADVANTTTAAAVGAAPGAPQPADTRGGLLGALAGSTYGALLSNQTGAQAGLAGQLAAAEGKRNAVAGGEDALYEQYLQAGYDDALKLSAARGNAAIAAGGLGIDQQNANSRSVSAAASASRADTARRNFEADQRNTTDPNMKKALDKALKAMNDTLKGRGTTTRTTGAVYHIKVPGNKVTGLADYTFDVSAKNGPEAAAKAWKQIQALGPQKLADYGITKWSNAWNVGMTPTTVTVPVTGSRTAALHAATAILENAGYSHSDALSFARRWLPPRARKKKKPVDRPGGPH